MWDGKKKAVTFSYDDGIVFDRRLVELFNRYGLKCTFNLNSGIMTGASYWKDGDSGVEIHRMNAKGLPELYKGHEIAVHCLTHASLTECDDETIYNEVMLDKQNLERMFDCEIHGMAYPYGTYNPHVEAILADCGIRYGRTVWALQEIQKPDPEHFLELRPTFHHNDAGLLDKVKAWVDKDASEIAEPEMLYIWGHSYEFETHQNWDRMEELCRLVSGRDDIYYGTNWDVLGPYCK